MSDEKFTVEHREAERRYVLIDHETDAVIGEEQYVDVGDERVMFHTVVADEYGGRGLASRLVRAAVDDAASHGYAIVPVCPYVKKWVETNPDPDRRLVESAPAHLRAVATR